MRTFPTARQAGSTDHRGDLRRQAGSILHTRSDVDAAAINNALRERQDDLESQLTAEESACYSDGSIFVHNAPGPGPSDIYIGDDPMDWMESFAGRLLARSYPCLHVSAHTLPQPICEGDIGDFFASIFGQTGTDGDLLCSLGPALGLSSRKSGGAYDSSNRTVFTIIQEKIGEGPAEFGELHRYLAHEGGLTGGLASLLLILFVRDERPEHQIQLVDEAASFMADGGRLLGTRLAPDLIPLIAWDRDLAANAMSSGPASGTRFNDIKHHSPVLYYLEIAFSGEDTAGDVLVRVIESIGEQTVAARQVLTSLGTGDDATVETANLQALLGRLNLVSGDDYTRVYRSVPAI